ncbi:MAG: hypothetical protein IJA55_02435 [Clostridia bacterium]|nr:hypothetical protein [Clostridia bacterium]
MSKKKIRMSSEAAYVLGILLIAFGNSLLEKASFGMSMVVAPAYLVYLKLSETFSFVTFGMACYAVEGILLIILMIIMRRFKLSYILSFVTAVIYGFVVDGFMALLSLVEVYGIVARILFFVPGVLTVTMGVAFMFHTYLAPEAYDLFVKELCDRFGFNTGRCKTTYDICSLIISAALTFIFFGGIKGLGVGTVICALFNGTLIGLYSHFMDKRCQFSDRLKLRRFFE